MPCATVSASAPAYLFDTLEQGVEVFASNRGVEWKPATQNAKWPPFLVDQAFVDALQADAPDDATPQWQPVALATRALKEPQIFIQHTNGTLYAFAQQSLTGELGQLWQQSVPAQAFWLTQKITQLPSDLARAAFDGAKASINPATVQSNGESSELVISGDGTNPVVLFNSKSGNKTPIVLTSSIGHPVGLPAVLMIHHENAAKAEQIQFYQATDDGRIWRISNKHALGWQAETLYQLSEGQGVADGGLQVFFSRAPMQELQSTQTAAPRALMKQAPGVIAPVEIVLAMTRHEQQFGLFVHIQALPERGQPATNGALTRQQSRSWYLPLSGRPVKQPLVLGSVVYLPLSSAVDCPFSPSYEKVAAINLLTGSAIYAAEELHFTQPQNSRMRLQKRSDGYSLGSQDSELIPQIKFLDPRCNFCVQLLQEQDLTQQKWLASFLPERAY